MLSGSKLGLAITEDGLSMPIYIVNGMIPLTRRQSRLPLTVTFPSSGFRPGALVFGVDDNNMPKALGLG